jgi:hypothetical protein
LKHGKGQFYFENGDKYDGEWENNTKHGHGIYTFGKGKWEGDKYEGMLVILFFGDIVSIVFCTVNLQL